MAANEFRTSCPILRREQLTLYFQTPQPRGVPTMQPFEQELVWLLESEVQILYVHGDKALKEGPSYSDFYGFLTSLDQNEELNRAKAWFSITESSSLDLRVVAKLFERPCLTPTSEDAARDNRRADAEPGKWKHVYAEIPHTWRTSEAHEEGDDKAMVYPTISRKEIREAVVYSSRRTDSDNAACMSEFRSHAHRWLAGAHSKSTFT